MSGFDIDRATKTRPLHVHRTVLMKHDSNLLIPGDVPAACSEKGMHVYLDSILEQLGHFSLRIMT